MDFNFVIVFDYKKSNSIAISLFIRNTIFIIILIIFVNYFGIFFGFQLPTKLCTPLSFHYQCHFRVEHVFHTKLA